MTDVQATNVLALPLVAVAITTGNNEDWVDAIEFVVDDGTGMQIDDMPQLDIRGIIFEMEVRRSASDNEVVLGASTESGTLVIGAPPDWGFLIIQIPLVEMQNMTAADYVADITGRDAFNQRAAVQIALTVAEGVTRQPVQKRVAIVVS
jgi:hypothetical protein